MSTVDKKDTVLAAAAIQVETGQPITMTTNLQDPPRYEAGATPQPHGLLIPYKAGTKGYVLKIGATAMRWNFACRLKGETVELTIPSDRKSFFGALFARRAA